MWRVSVVLGALLAVMAAQTAQAPQAEESQQSPQAQQAWRLPELPDAAQVIPFLNQSIEWHRQIAVLQPLATDPADVLYLNEAMQVANQALQLSFDFAKADAELLAKTHPATPGAGATEAGTPQSLAQAAASAQAEVTERQSQLDALNQQLARATGGKRRDLQTQVAALQSELELEKTRRDTLRNIVQFVGTTGGASGLAAQIDALQRSVPELAPNAAQPAKPSNAAGASGTGAARKPPTGLMGLIEDLTALHGKRRALRQAIVATDSLSQAAGKLRAPLVASLTSMSRQGDQIVRQTSGATPAQLEAQKATLDALTAQFKQLAAATVPLGKLTIALDGYKRDLQRWDTLIGTQSVAALRQLGVRLLVLVVVLAVVIALAEIWLRAIFRYVHDVRRRYQFLLLRRIAIWIAVGLAIAFALASEIGSLATFVGLITAGMAVALQNVILAVAGYFFLIGRFGVRVGDRVQIGGVIGDVIDIGLIRLHLMEVGDAKNGRQPTGRVVVFSNAIVFQPGASFFKQIPGTNFTWHDISLTLAPETDYQVAEARLLEAVQAVYADYKQRIEEQHRRLEQTFSVPIAVPRPQSRLQFVNGGLEVMVRYPTEVEHAAAIDDAVTRRLLQAIDKSPKLKLVGSGTPNIQPVEEAPEQKAS